MARHELLSVYAVYKGEELLAEGTTKELAERFNVTEDTVHYWTTPRNARKDKGKRKVACKIGRVKDFA